MQVCRASRPSTPPPGEASLEIPDRLCALNQPAVFVAAGGPSSTARCSAALGRRRVEMELNARFRRQCRDRWRSVPQTSLGIRCLGKQRRNGGRDGHLEDRLAPRAQRSCQLPRERVRGDGPSSSTVIALRQAGRRVRVNLPSSLQPHDKGPTPGLPATNVTWLGCVQSVA